MLNASVVVCTHNRCASLRRTLRSLEELEVPTGLKWAGHVASWLGAALRGERGEAFFAQVQILAFLGYLRAAIRDGRS